MFIQRGDLFYADLSPVIGSEQGGFRPVLIIQNNIGNRYSPTVIIAAITSKIRTNRLPTHVFLPGGIVGLGNDSIVLLEQVRTIDRIRLKKYIGRLDEVTMKKVDTALAVSMGMLPI